MGGRKGGGVRPTIILASVLCALSAREAIGQASVADGDSYPVKPVRIIIPGSPGSGADTMARTIGQKLAATWGQSFVVENRPGAGGIIGLGGRGQVIA